MEEVHSNRHLLARTSPLVGVSVRLRRSPCLPVQILPRLGARPCRPWRIAVELPQVFDRGVEVRGFVYTARDVAGNVLYVGVTRNVERRMKAHRRSSRWWRLHSTLEVEEFATLEEAADAEDRAICRHDPPFNVRGGHPAAPWDCPGRRCRRLRSEADRVALANRRRWGGVRRGWSPTRMRPCSYRGRSGVPRAGVGRCGRGGRRGQRRGRRRGSGEVAAEVVTEETGEDAWTGVDGQVASARWPGPRGRWLATTEGVSPDRWLSRAVRRRCGRRASPSRRRTLARCRSSERARRRGDCVDSVVCRPRDRRENSFVDVKARTGQVCSEREAEPGYVSGGRQSPISRRILRPQAGLPPFVSRIRRRPRFPYGPDSGTDGDPDGPTAFAGKVDGKGLDVLDPLRQG